MNLPRLDLSTDVLVIGNGGAGLRAAIAAADAGCRVLVLSKLTPRRPNATTLILGWGAHRESHEVDEYFAEVVAEGGWLSHQELAWIYASEVPVRMPELRAFGVDMRLEEAEQERPGVIRPLWYLPGPRGRVGESVSLALRRAAGERGVELRYQTQVSRLLTRDGAVVGAAAVDAAAGQVLAIAAGAVVLATGGTSRLYARNNNPPGTTGDGFALALRAGAELVDLEFDTFVLPHEQLVRLFADRSSEAEILASASGAHYSCGGVRVDAERRASVPGLYAAGECAGGTFGAARLGSTSVAEIVISGYWAGSGAAREANRRGVPDLEEGEVRDELGHLRARRGDGEDAEGLRSAIQRPMWLNAGPVRRDAGLRGAEDELEGMRARAAALGAADAAGLAAAVEVDLMLDAARAIVAAARKRTESRGAHWRLDHPEPDNGRWLVNQVVRHGPGGAVEVVEHPVAMTRLTVPGRAKVGTRWTWGYVERPG